VKSTFSRIPRKEKKNDDRAYVNEHTCSVVSIRPYCIINIKTNYMRMCAEYGIGGTRKNIMTIKTFSRCSLTAISTT